MFRFVLCLVTKGGRATRGPSPPPIRGQCRNKIKILYKERAQTHGLEAGREPEPPPIWHGVRTRRPHRRHPAATARRRPHGPAPGAICVRDARAKTHPSSTRAATKSRTHSGLNVAAPIIAAAHRRGEPDAPRTRELPAHDHTRNKKGGTTANQTATHTAARRQPPLSKTCHRQESRPVRERENAFGRKASSA
jgi:hypothetical protein